MRILLTALATVISVLILTVEPAFAQVADSAASKQLEDIEKYKPVPEVVTAPVAQTDKDYGAFRIQQDNTHRLLMVVVIAAAIASLIIVLWFLKGVGTRDAMTMVNASGLVLVVYGTILVVMLAKADQQLTAAIGILGAVAGYLFGSTARARKAEDAEGRP